MRSCALGLRKSVPEIRSSTMLEVHRAGAGEHGLPFAGGARRRQAREIHRRVAFARHALVQLHDELAQ